MELKDRRLQRRFDGIVAAMKKAPEESFPKAFADDSELEATYRFLNNERVTWQELLAPHLEETVARVAKDPVVLAVHDSTSFMFGGESGRHEVGTLDGKGPSFLGHFAIAVST